MKKLIPILILAFVLQSCKNKEQKETEKKLPEEITKSNTVLISENEISTVFSNFAKIVDKDGFVNVRNDANAKSRIIGKINSDEIIYVFNKGDENGDWLIIDYHEKDNLLTGYVHTSRIKPISDYEDIPSVIDDENGVNFILRNIEVSIKSGAFNYKENQKYFSEEQHADDYKIQKYKGQEVWGTDGTIPRTHYTSIMARVGNQTIRIPEKEIENLFNINNEFANCYFDEKNETLYITLNNSDGAGSYEVLFIIEKGKYKGRRMYYTS